MATIKNFLIWLKQFAKRTMEVTRLNDIRPTLFLLSPCAWGVLLAKNRLDKQAIIYIALFAMACLCMYTAGCTVNDFIDRNIDLQIPRTKNRPLAARTYSATLALLIAFMFSMVGLRIATMFNTLTTIISIVAGALIVVYPFSKRYFFAPQFILGIAANTGALIGYSAVSNSISIGVCTMYLGGVYWTACYDTIYAYQDREHDKRMGIHSLAVIYGAKTKGRLKSLLTTAFICFACAGFLERNRMSFGYYIFLFLIYLFLFKFLEEVDLENPAECYRGLMVNTVGNALVIAACLAGRTLAN